MDFFINSTYNIPIKKVEELPTILPSLSNIYTEVEDDNINYLSSIFSDNDTLFLWKSSKICYKLTRYDLIPQFIAFSSITQSEIYKPLSYHKAI